MCLKKNNKEKKDKKDKKVAKEVKEILQKKKLEKKKKQDSLTKHLVSEFVIYKYCFWNYTILRWRTILAAILVGQIPTFLYTYILVAQRNIEDAGSQKDYEKYTQNLIVFIFLEFIEFLAKPLKKKLDYLMSQSLQYTIKRAALQRAIQADHDILKLYQYEEDLYYNVQYGERYIIEYIALNPLVEKFEQIYQLVIKFLFLYNISTEVTALMISLLPIQIAIEHQKKKQVFKQRKEQNKKQKKYSQIRGYDLGKQIETIKVQQAEKTIIAQHNSLKKYNRQVKLRGIIFDTLRDFINTLIEKVLVLACIYVFYQKSQNKQEELLVSSLTLSMAYVGVGYKAFMKLQELFLIFFTDEDQKNWKLVEVNNMLKLLKYEPKIKYDSGIILKDFKGEVEFKNVSFKYPDTEVQVLKNVSFKIKAGEYVAFAGKSGHGKSTVMHLIQRFYLPNEGDIFIDGVNIKDLNIFYLRQNFGVVTQKSVVIDMSIKDNLLYGVDREIPDSEIEKIVKDTGMSTFVNDVKKFPRGLETKLGYDIKTKEEMIREKQEKEKERLIKLKEEEEEKKKLEQKKDQQETKESEQNKGEQDDEKKSLLQKIKDSKKETENKNKEEEKKETENKKQEEEEEEEQLEYTQENQDAYYAQKRKRRIERKISGGQTQILAIARCLLRDPKFIILDEATSALDSRSEKQIQDCLNVALKKKITCIVIAHRLSSIANCQKIFLIDDGLLVEQGTHEELFKSQGKYYNLVKHEIEATKNLAEENQPLTDDQIKDQKNQQQNYWKKFLVSVLKKANVDIEENEQLPQVDQEQSQSDSSDDEKLKGVSLTRIASHKI